MCLDRSQVQAGAVVANLSPFLIMIGHDNLEWLA